MAIHCSTLAWKIPWTEEPGGLQSTGSQSRTRLSGVTYSNLEGLQRQYRACARRASGFPGRPRNQDSSVQGTQTTGAVAVGPLHQVKQEALQ